MNPNNILVLSPLSNTLCFFLDQYSMNICPFFILFLFPSLEIGCTWM